MSYLEQLKQQAAQKRQAEQTAVQQRNQQQVIMEQQLKPAMATLHHYLYEMCQQLNYLKPETRVAYQIEGYDKLDNLLQGEYILDQYTEAQDKLLLRCSCEGQYKFRFAKQTEQSAKHQLDYLYKHNLRFLHQTEFDEQQKFKCTIFELTPIVFVEFSFTTNPAKACIDLTVRNFHSLGKKFYTLAPQSITQQWLDEFAKYILREPNKLHLSEKYQLTTEGQRKIQDYRRSRDQEEFDMWLEKMQQETAQQEKTNQRRGLFSWLKRS